MRIKDLDSQSLIGVNRVQFGNEGSEYNTLQNLYSNQSNGSIFLFTEAARLAIIMFLASIIMAKMIFW